MIQMAQDQSQTIPMAREIVSKSSNQILNKPILSNNQNVNSAGLTFISVRPNDSITSTGSTGQTINATTYQSPRATSLQESLQKEDDHTQPQHSVP